MDRKSLPKQLPPSDQQRLDDLYDYIAREAETFLGYPCTTDFDYGPLYRFLKFPINNVGDPFVESNFHLNTHEIEREVLSIFRELTQAPADSFWGYVTSGGTEGNLYGIFLARELYPDGLVYYSEDTHYSVSKILRCLRVRNVMIKSCPDGRIDLEDLRETIHIHRDVPPIICANVGTTMKGAVDDLSGIREILHDLAVPAHYIHCDAALSGMILPFVDDPPQWNFAAGIDSIAVSGHKMVGSPLPCGVVVAVKSNVDRIARHVEYVGTMDTTILGSRNAITPLFLWYALRTVGKDGFRQKIRRCLDMADYAVERLQAAGRNAWRHENSVTVVFDRPSSRLAGKWQLAGHHNVAHIITMPHVTRKQIDLLAADLEAESGRLRKIGSEEASDEQKPTSGFAIREASAHNARTRGAASKSAGRTGSDSNPPRAT